MKATDRQDTVTESWVGQDGSKWRELRVWVGNGHRYFLQKNVNGAWI